MLILGVLYQIKTMLGSHSELDKVKLDGLVRAPGNVPVSLMLVVTVLLLLVSVWAAADVGAAAGYGGQ